MDFNEIMRELPPAMQAEFADMTRLFESNGWSILRQALEDELEACKERALSAPDWETKRFEDGKRHVIGTMLGYEASFENIYRTQAEDAAEDRRLQVEGDPL